MTTEDKAMVICYRVSNLAQLQEMIDDCLANARAARGRKVEADEIAIGTSEVNFIEATLESRKLTDSSEVFDLNF